MWFQDHYHVTETPDNAILSAVLTGSMFIFLINLFPHTETIAIVIGVGVAWFVLMDEGINDYYGLVTSILYILIAWFQLRIGWIQGEYYPVEMLSLLVLGGIGLGLVLLDYLLGRVVAGISSFSLLSMALKIRKIVSIRTYVSGLGILLAILVNVCVRILSPPFISEVIAVVTSVCAFALILWASFSVESVQRIINYIGSLISS